MNKKILLSFAMIIALNTVNLASYQAFELTRVTTDGSLSVDKHATSPEGTKLYNNTYVNLFNVQYDQDSTLTVDASEVDYQTPGEYDVTFTETDLSGDIDTMTSSIEITDVLPTISIGNEHVQAETYTQIDLADAFEVSATELKSDDLLTSVVVDDSAVDYATVGHNTVIFSVSDNDGNTVSTTGDLYLRASDSNLNITADECASSPEGTKLYNNSYVNLFNVQYDQDATLTVDASDVDYTTPGEYSVTFTETDASGHSASVTSTIQITDVLPTISLGNEYVQAETYTQIDLAEAFGVSASEFENDDLLTSVVVDDSAVDYTVVGHNTVTFSVSDNDGNTVSTTGDLYLRSNAPTITADDEQSTTEGTVLTDDQLISLFNVSATDTDGLDTITVNDDTVDYQAPGTYTIVFTAVDVYGDSTSVQASLVITDIKPIITTDTSSITVEANSTVDLISEFNVVASEITTGDLTSQLITNDDQLDLTTTGTYPVSFEVSDDEGNTALATTSVTVNATTENTCLNNAGKPNNSHNCNESTTCNNNGNDCDNGQVNGNGNGNGNGKH